MTVRAKLRCQSVRTYAAAPARPDAPTPTPARSYEFTAEYDPSVPEDRRFSLHTPSAQLTMYVDNPAVAFEPGATYYLDFTPVES